jgi:endonuclease/exonuclease/phosphatase family metal-dependent hydrolase
MPAELKVIVWNAQGASGAKVKDKWDYLWAYMAQAHNNVDVIGLIAESGWAPWYKSGPAKLDSCIRMDSSRTYFEPSYTSDMMECIEKTRQLKEYWAPWVRDAEDFSKKTNARCSLGAIIWPAHFVFDVESRHYDEVIRPTMRVKVGINQGTGKTTHKFTIYLVHLLSGNEDKATAEKDRIAAAKSQVEPEGVPTLVVGDYNINLQNDPDLGLGEGWQVLRTNQPTQKSGGELDFGLLHSLTKGVEQSDSTPPGILVKANVASDHAMICYTLVIG